ncbi:PQQ-binding-like beta-propeller repeat protein [Pontiella agarivorans]|uniref:PQQ-binding-like beta-propeller repeat protein n=1 Tax=Pontiella agarivorans TaxID=3038953 RepID=A0ABU5MYN2_9BACT|nr:PQQ-binding-like beta-propeller repeat protein [Pontiella agarivorans]MDZ8119299.1 PQQ-binding-like beta-propeller repeat protein [Pontiella agarivorans]
MMLPGDVAVVPIFVNAGAALLPAMAAGIATFFALLFKPRALLKACKEKPLIPLGVLLVIGGVWAAVKFRPSHGGAPVAAETTRSPAQTGSVYIDWTEVALQSIKARARGELKSVQPRPSVALQTAGVEEPVMFRGGSARLGARGAAPEGELKLVWDYYPSWVDDDGSVEVVDSAMMLSSPAVFGDRIYSASCELDPPDSYGIVFCVNAGSGETIWSIDQVEGEELMGFFSSPAVTADGKYVLIGQGLHPDTNCRLICIDAEKGEVHWTVQSELHIESSPAIENGVVYVGAGAIEDPATHKPVSHTGYVMAIRIEDGKELWRHDVADPESSPIVKDGVVYIGSGFNGKAVVALRVEEELEGQPREIWRTETPYPITGAVTLVDDIVIVGGGNGDFVFRDPDPAGVVMALDAKTGKVRWSTAMPDAVLGAVAAGKYLIAPVAAGRVMALDPSTGNTVWSTAVSGQAPVLAGASIAGDVVYAVSHDGYLATLSLETGEVLDKIYINDRTRPGEQGLSISSPMIQDGRIYVGSETGGLRCYEGS